MSMGFVQKSKKDLWQTPPELWKNINRLDNIDLDPCPGSGTAIGDMNFWLDLGMDGLGSPWWGSVFLNPPFSQKTEWIDKAIEEIELGNVDVIYVVTPDSTDVQSWWHDRLVPNCEYSWFSRGRINYVDPNTGNQAKGVSFGTAVSIMGDPPKEVLNWMRRNGDLVKRGLTV